MQEIYANIYIGSVEEAEKLFKKKDWSFLLCCKDPKEKDVDQEHHELSEEHNSYSYITRGHRMAMNFIDLPIFNKESLIFTRDMFAKAFDFLDEERSKHRKVLIYCNNGESGAPSVGLLYIARQGKYGDAAFDKAFKIFKKEFPDYNPKENIYTNIKYHWDYFVFET